MTSHGCNNAIDRAVLMPENRVVWVELKQETGELSPQQELVIRKMQRAGHKVVVPFSLKEAQDAIVGFETEWGIER